MISTRLKEAELQYIKARQNYTLALQKLNILMGEDPNNPVDLSLIHILHGFHGSIRLKPRNPCNPYLNNINLIDGFTFGSLLFIITLYLPPV